MPPNEQQVEDQNGETEVVVIGGPHDSTKGPSLEFRRREGRDTDLAQVGVPIDSDLKAIAVDKLHCCVLRNRDAAVVDVSDDTMILMDHGKGTRNVSCYTQKKPEVRRGKFRPAALGAVELVDVLAAGDSWHQEAVRRVAVGHDNAGRPGCGPLQSRAGQRSHREDLLDALGRERLVIDLGDGVSTAIDLVNAPFAAGAETRAHSDKLASGICEGRHSTLL
jgi:hypothetical protein